MGIEVLFEFHKFILHMLHVEGDLNCKSVSFYKGRISFHFIPTETEKKKISEQNLLILTKGCCNVFSFILTRKPWVD